MEPNFVHPKDGDHNEDADCAKVLANENNFNHTEITITPEIIKRLPKSELHIFSDAGHGVYGTEREGFRKLLLDFLRRSELI